MLLEVKKLQEAAVKILAAVDGGDVSEVVKDTVEIKTYGKTLQLNVTNKEYYVRVSLPIQEEVPFKAVVDAKLFLNLISKITTENLELNVDDKKLVIKANGNYKLPLIYDNDTLIEVPEINIEEETTSFNISSDILSSILNYNSKEINTAKAVKPFQKLYYIDEQGCMTFSSGGCINSFTLPEKITLLLNTKLVKLFRLFKDGDIKFTLGHDEVAGVIQTKIKLENDEVAITSITSTSDSILATVPVRALRERANFSYDYQVNFEKTALTQALTRLLLFNNARGGLNKDFGVFEFNKTSVSIYDANKENKEVIPYVNSTISTQYKAILDINALKTTLDSCNEDILLFNFGDRKCFVLSRGNIKNLMPEGHE